MFRGIVDVIHFVGIGGIGMSGIAEVLLSLGFAVTGSDLKEGATVERLRGLGAEIHIGHKPENIGDADVVVRSTAVGESNPEVAAALERRIPVIRRAEMLAELMRLEQGIGVAGSHGKTTTTSMVAAILTAGEFDPTVVIGGRLDSLGGSNAKVGRGNWLVAEADESDGSFMLLSPVIAMVTNIDPEHMDHYGTVQALEDTFLAYCNKVPFYGFTAVCVDDPTIQRLLPQMRRRVITYGFARHARFRASHIRQEGLHTTFTLHHDTVVLGDITLDMPGRHNVQNALGALAVAMELGVPFATAAKALHGFTGVQRRFTVRGEAKGVLVVDDYGHHPTEIRATLAAAGRGFPGRRVVAVFQPHRFSRVQEHWDDFCMAFPDADVVVCCPVYRAGETPIEGIDHERLAREMRERGHHGAHTVDSLEDGLEWLATHLEEGDVVITLGAGNVNSICAPLLERLEG